MKMKRWVLAGVLMLGGCSSFWGYSQDLAHFYNTHPNLSVKQGERAWPGTAWEDANIPYKTYALFNAQGVSYQDYKTLTTAGLSPESILAWGKLGYSAQQVNAFRAMGITTPKEAEDWAHRLGVHARQMAGLPPLEFDDFLKLITAIQAHQVSENSILQAIESLPVDQSKAESILAVAHRIDAGQPPLLAVERYQHAVAQAVAKAQERARVAQKYARENAAIAQQNALANMCRDFISTLHEQDRTYKLYAERESEESWLWSVEPNLDSYYRAAADSCPGADPAQVLWKGLPYTISRYQRLHQTMRHNANHAYGLE